MDGKWYCHFHDPDGAFRQNLASPDADGQMIFSDLDMGAALFAHANKEAARIASKRIKSFSKWNREKEK